jgi:hypothetical protein
MKFKFFLPTFFVASFFLCLFADNGSGVTKGVILDVLKYTVGFSFIVMSRLCGCCLRVNNPIYKEISAVEIFGSDIYKKLLDLLCCESPPENGVKIIGYKKDINKKDYL